jgi:flagellar protein FlbD
VILLTRLGGPVFALNPDLIERADCTPDTVITLVDGKKYVVAESLPEVMALIRQFRATIVADAQHITHHSPDEGPAYVRPGRRIEHIDESRTGSDTAPTNVVRIHPRER